MEIDWKAIRPLNGSRQTGFEELCAQLAADEKPVGSLFKRKGTPDAGVECFAVLIDGKEWGWQAKYFDGLGDSQWAQLDDSVRTVLEKHPQLTRYFICVPLDRPDARIPRRRSAMERWDEHVQKWTEWASKRGMDVEYIYWGSHELLSRLMQPQHVGRLRFFFDHRYFDKAWFAARLEEAVKTAGPRYTPEIHVNLPIAADFEAFGRTECFFERLKAHARYVREKLRHLGYTQSKDTDESPDILSALSTVRSLTDLILSDLGNIQVQPVGELNFPDIVAKVAAAESAAVDLEKKLLAAESTYHEKLMSVEGGGKAGYTNRFNPFRDRLYRLFALQRRLKDLAEALGHAQKMASGNLILLSGEAGTGKTHLLCDVAKKRIKENRPTVILMGQQFISTEAPWSQVLQQLDLPGFSAEVFVGALEAAAEFAGCRALVIIDALNEGAGRRIWPNHLAAFLAHLARSPWIGVVLAVRSSYQRLVIPDEVHMGAVDVEHHGFSEHEYDATRTFFAYYGLELPSTPLLAPEFHNPLFLKTLCCGLRARGERRLPRGFHGITFTFGLYLTEINQRLSDELNFNPRSSLVSKALDAFAKALVEAGQRWLPLAKAEEVVNALLPGREFDRSLYQGLTAEGILVEEAIASRNSESDEVVFVGYDRFADHLVAKSLLDVYPDSQALEAAFSPKAPLGFLCDPKEDVFPGLLEALCVQIPERTGKEITEIAPQVQDIWGIGDAFRRSIIWRSPESFSEVTLQTLNRLARTDYDWNETHDVILTVATLPEHPFNAAFLNQRLRRDTMPERDAWWSIFLHNAWRSHGAVDRLVDWASSVGHEDALEDETVDLCATALAWMLTSSNRQLRDRVTKALVALMTGRLGAVIRMVKRFADVDDLYVTERIYAVAYGTAMRSYNAKEVGALATCVYDKVFATGMPPAHILLRDYARGVVERAIHLESDISIVTDHIRPPYNSTWPSIPTEEEIKPFLPDWSRGSHDSGDLEWARNRIGSSVMHDDFARYVIGTNSGPYSSHWLSLPLVQPRWKSPGELLDELVSGFSQDEKNAWGEFTAAEATFNQKQIERLLLSIRKGSVVKEPQDERNVDEEQIENNGHHRDIDAAKEELNAAFGRLEAVITEGHARLLKDILAEKRDADARRGPRFDLRLIQRYILWRVFDLGWTTERFGQFDRFAIGYHGREPSKAERFGKKYQWIAYHEILALVADNFQYRREYGEDGGGQGYEGPWQESLRDIDPSCLLRAPGKKSEGDFGSWWPPFEYARWDEPQDHLEWVKHYDDIPSFEDLLRTFCPRNNSWWITLQSHFNWNQPTPADRESTEVERREIWLMCTGYLVRADDGPTFMAWAEGADFWGRWMPEPPENYRIFFGEYGWSPASRYFDQEYFGGRRWEQPGYDCPVEVQTGVQEYLAGSSSFDFSVDEGYRLRLPCEALVTGLGIEWSGSASDFVDRSGNVIAFDPTAYEDGPGVLLLRQDYLQDFLEREQLTICWAVIGEKRVIGGGFEPQYYSALRINGAYQLTTGKPNGFLKCLLESRTVRKGEISQDLLATIRTQQGI